MLWLLLFLQNAGCTFLKKQINIKTFWIKNGKVCSVSSTPFAAILVFLPLLCPVFHLPLNFSLREFLQFHFWRLFSFTSADWWNSTLKAFWCTCRHNHIDNAFLWKQWQIYPFTLLSMKFRNNPTATRPPNYEEFLKLYFRNKKKKTKFFKKNLFIWAKLAIHPQKAETTCELWAGTYAERGRERSTAFLTDS